MAERTVLRGDTLSFSGSSLAFWVLAGDDELAQRVNISTQDR